MTRRLHINMGIHRFCIDSLVPLDEIQIALSEWALVLKRVLTEGILVPKEARDDCLHRRASFPGEIEVECSGCGAVRHPVVPARGSWGDTVTCVGCGWSTQMGAWHPAKGKGAGNYETLRYWDEQGVCLENGMPSEKMERVQEACTGEVGTRDPDAYLRKQMDDNLRGMFT